jgi:hypothetical protein
MLIVPTTLELGVPRARRWQYIHAGMRGVARPKPRAYVGWARPNAALQRELISREPLICPVVSQIDPFNDARLFRNGRDSDDRKARVNS